MHLADAVSRSLPCDGWPIAVPTGKEYRQGKRMTKGDRPTKRSHHNTVKAL
jgi:hypothetical protein